MRPMQSCSAPWRNRISLERRRRLGPSFWNYLGIRMLRMRLRESQKSGAKVLGQLEHLKKAAPPVTDEPCRAGPPEINSGRGNLTDRPSICVPDPGLTIKWKP